MAGVRGDAVLGQFLVPHGRLLLPPDCWGSRIGPRVYAVFSSWGENFCLGTQLVE